MKRISILGATGSIGQNTLDLIASEKDFFEVVALTGSQNVDLLAQNAIKFNAKFAVTLMRQNFEN